MPIAGRVLSIFASDRMKDSLDKIRKNLENRLRTLNRPLVVFFDDFDWLEPV